MKRQVTKVLSGFCFICVFLCVEYSLAFWKADEGLDGKTKKAIKQGVLNKEVDIIPQLHKLNVGFGRYNDIEYYFIKTVSKIFFQDKPIVVKVKDLEFEKCEISMDLCHPILDCGKIKYVFSERLLKNISPDKIKKILLTTLSDENNQYVFCNPQSKTYHLHICNHLPVTEQPLRMKPKDAEGQGYRRCGFCFRKMRYLPHLPAELALEREWSARLRYYEPVLYGPEKQAHVRKLGETILRNWPFQPLGYDYSFNIVQSKEMNACSMPTGKIFVTSALYDSLENEEELEAILIHEIAHAERRHGLRQIQMLQKATKDQQELALGAAIFAGAAAAAASKDRSSSGAVLAAGIASVVAYATITAIQLDMYGYNKDFEREADALTALYFDIHNKNKSNLKAIFKKLQFNNLCETMHPDLQSRTHPELIERIERAEKTQFSYFGMKKNFICKRKEKAPIQLDLICQRVFENENKLDVYISDRSLLGKYRKALAGGANATMALLVKDSNGSHTFELNENFATEDAWGTYLTLEKSSEGEIDFGDVEKAKEMQFLEDVKEIELSIQVRRVDASSEPLTLEKLSFVEGKIHI